MNLMCDVTSNCNLRCSFCVNEWSRIITGNVNMTPEAFNRVIEMAREPHVAMCFISCAFEPLIHPELPGLLALIPSEIREKCFLSTNLSIPLTDRHLQAFSESNLDYINISCESFEPELYEHFRVGAQWHIFWDNLLRLQDARAQATNPPDLRIVSMLFRENADAMQAFHTQVMLIGADLHEIRTPFEWSIGNMPQRFVESSILSKDEALAVFDGFENDGHLLWRLPDITIDSSGLRA